MTEVRAEIAANVWKVTSRSGQVVEAGAALAILESMKMEIPVESPGGRHGGRGPRAPRRPRRRGRRHRRRRLSAPPSSSILGRLGSTSRRAPAALRRLSGSPRRPGGPEALVARLDVVAVGRLGDGVRRTQDHVGLLDQHPAMVAAIGDLGQPAQAVELADHHRRHPSPGLADLVEGPVDQALVADPGLDEPDLAIAVAVGPAVADPALDDHAQPVAQPVDARQGGERVVDRRRQRPDGDLDQLVDGEGQVLGRVRWGPVDVGPPQLVGHERRRRRAATPGPAVDRLDHEVARPVDQLDDGVVRRRPCATSRRWLTYCR